jgi:hypothetical protein
LFEHSEKGPEVTVEIQSEEIETARSVNQLTSLDSQNQLTQTENRPLHRTENSGMVVDEVSKDKNEVHSENRFYQHNKIIKSSFSKEEQNDLQFSTSNQNQKQQKILEERKNFLHKNINNDNNS